MRHLIIDIESYLYKSITASKTLVKLNNKSKIYIEGYDVDKALTYIKENIDRLCYELGTNSFELVVGDKKNFRKELNPQYKANREAKPQIYFEIWKEANKQFGFASLTNLEGDDTCRIMYEDKNYHPDKEKIIVSIDKDFFTVPCKFYRDLPSNTEGIIDISKKEAEQNLLKQIITGDTADNYKGIPNFGEKKVENFWELHNQVVNAADVLQLFKDTGLTGDDYVMNKCMARIVGIKQYNFDTGKVDLNKE